ncbi:ATP-dependent nuclease [Bdellovibrio sp. HCB117]|uniref:ATP-dependent nuclease n=1 Tax=Bdellovibrio sp. HCB117 TaxID=3394359 RepID=UPI0039B6C314
MKLNEISIANFGPIGPEGCRIKIDNIVILIGPNNVGKSTILDAYELFASSGEAVDSSRFHGKENSQPITIEGEFTDIGDEDEKKFSKWIFKDAEDGIKKAKFRWKWDKPGADGIKESWDDSEKKWITGGAGGWDSILSSRIPHPIRIRATDSHDKTEKVVVGLLTDAIKAKIKSNAGSTKDILDQIAKLTDQLGQELKVETEKVCNAISKKVQTVFPSYEISIKASAGDFDAEKVVGGGSFVSVNNGGSEAALSAQGSGMQRTFLWSAISALAEEGKIKKGKTPVKAEKSKILLIDEPEAFLHPPLIRLARRSLYDLADIDGWQVMAATHSPVFIDVSKPHTTIVSVRFKASTKSFSVQDDTFDSDQRKNLQMIRACHPTVNEFFFAEKVILVEGETEAIVLNHLFEKEVNAHEVIVLNCLGKANLATFAKILNKFGTPYVIVHDADSPKIKTKKGVQANGAWSENKKIFAVIQDYKNKEGAAPQIVTSVPDFERHYFGELVEKDKPYHAYQKVTDEQFQKEAGYKKLVELKDFILKGDGPAFTKDMDDMCERLLSWVGVNALEKEEVWEIN